MRNVVITQYVTIKNDETKGTVVHRHSKAIIPCSSKAEAEAIAEALQSVRYSNALSNTDRETKAAVHMFDEVGRSVFFTREYLEHVLSDLNTETEHTPRRLREAK